MTDLVIVDGIVILRIVLGAYHPVTDTETIPLVDKELDVALVGLVETVVLMKHVVEEGLAQLTWLDLVQTCREEDVGVVHIDNSRLLRETLLGCVEHIDESCLLQIREIVDDCGTAGLDALGKETDIRRTRCLLRKNVEKLLKLRQVTKFDLLEEEDVNLEHSVHALDEHLAVVLLLKEEWIVAVVDVILEIVERFDLAADLGCDGGMVGQDLIIGVSLEVGACHEIDILAERETTQVIGIDNAVEHRIGLFETHHRGSGKYDLDLRILVMDELQLVTPVRILENLVDEERTTTLLLEIGNKLPQRVSVEVEMIHVDVKTPVIVRAVFFQGILKKECGLAYTTTALDADETATPVDFVDERTTYRTVHVLHEVLVCSKESLHYNKDLVFMGANISNIFQFAKSNLHFF